MSSFSKFTGKDFAQIDKEKASLLDIVRKRCPDNEEYQVVCKAFEFANEAHKNVRRRSGEPYILHPMAVARIVVENIGLGYKSISAALLHDVVEDTDYSVEDIRNLFGDKIASLVEGLTKIKTVLDNEDRNQKVNIYTESLQAENFKRILLTLGDDVRVVLIKLADRLHNCRTIDSMPEHKRDKILSETMFIFIPLAHRLGLYGIKSEMENIWLRFKEPEAYNDIATRIKWSVEIRDKEIDAFIAPIEKSLTDAGYKFTILKRIKTPYSIWRKMQTKGIPFEQVYDLYAVRIIFDPVSGIDERQQAYLIYSIVTSLYKDQPGRMRDWIKLPKSNGYEALHCTLMSQVGIWVEVQIRSRRMDDIAEKGIAAHWAYKKEGYITENDSEMDKWLAKLQDILTSKDMNASELLDIIHNDLISSQIVVFTPKGEQKSIQNGATALDFAYLIHTHIGHSAIAAKVNMKLVPLSRVLKQGDQVEIITTSEGHPQLDWLQFVQTRHARNLIIDYFRISFKEYVAKGDRIYHERLLAMEVPDDIETFRKFQGFAQINDRKELLFRIGLGLIGPEEFKTILKDSAISTEHSDNSFVISTSKDDGRKYEMASCCNPIPGDPVIGLLYPDGTVMVHKKSCKTAERIASKHGNWLVVPEWGASSREDFPVRISIKGIDRVGILNELTFFISKTLGVNIRKIHLGSDGGVFEGYLELLVSDRDGLNEMLDGFAKIDGIREVVRTDI